MGGEDIIFRMGMNTSSFEASLQKVHGSFSHLLDDLGPKLAAGLTLGALSERFSELSARLKATGRDARELGVGFEFLQGMQVGAVKFGATAEDISGSLGKLNVKIGEARSTSAEAARDFKSAGIALYGTNGMARTTEEIFREISNKFRDGADSAERAELAFRFFGKSAANIHSILDLGSAGLDKFNGKLKESGKIIEAELANEITDLTEALKSNQSWFDKGLAGAASLFNGFGKYSAQASVYLGKGGLQDDLKRIVGIFDDKTNSSVFSERAKEVANLRAQLEKVKRLAGVVVEPPLDANQKKNLEEIQKLGKERANAQRDLGAAAGQFEVNDAIDKELKLRLTLAGMKDDDQRRAGVQDRIAAAVGERAAAELRTKQEALRELSDAAGELEQEIKGLGFAEDNKIEKEKKSIELAKMQKDIAQAAAGIEKDKLDILKQQGDARARAVRAGAALADAKGERTKFTIGELASANLRGVSDSRLREDIIAAREVQRLESRAMFLKNRGGVGDLEEAARTFSLADNVRGGIQSAKDSDRYPMKGLEQAQKDAVQELKEINAKTGQPPKFGK